MPETIHPERHDCTDLPITIEDTDEKVVQIREDECGNCRYDRIRVVHHKYAGVHQLTCTLCGHYSEDGREWTPPTTDRDHIEDMKRHADIDGPLERLGYLDPSQSIFGAGTNPVYGYSDGTSLHKWVRNGNIGSLPHNELVNLVCAIAESGHFDGSDAHDIVDALVDGDCLDPDEWHNFDRLMLMETFKPDHLTIDEWHTDEGDDSNN